MAKEPATKDQYHDPPDPNHPSGSTSRPRSQSHEAAPAIVASVSHVGTHVLPRRFLGPMPEVFAHSDEVEERHRRIRSIQRAALKRVNGAAEAGRKGGRAIGDTRRKVVDRIRGEDREVAVDLDSDSDESERRLRLRKKKKKRKDVWVGESFDIGREFRTDAMVDLDEQQGGREPVREGEESESIPPASPIDERRADSAPPSLARPPTSRGTTQDSFVTARTQFSDARSTVEPGYELNAVSSTSVTTASPAMGPKTASPSSSLHPLISEPPRLTLSPKTSIPEFKRRLKSAIRRPSSADTPARNRSKSVQFPLNPERDGGTFDHPRRGNKAPADPESVLEREGSDMVGTSAEAVQAAEDEEDEEEDFSPGQVIMRDRALVRVGYNREDNIMNFDEAMQRRKPCSRIEPMQEYIVVWRKGRVEFYEEWKTPLKGRITGHKKLAYFVPLHPTRSSLTVFNETDLTLSLTTSAAKLSEDLDAVLRSDTTRAKAFKNRMKESAQGKWLLSGRKGTHVFIIKFAERSRAMDWYWELWRELDGELPNRMDVSVPAFTTTIRMALPKEDEVGSRATCQAFNIENSLQIARDGIKGAIDLDRLLRQRDIQLELAWKSTNGRLEWLCWDKTVQGRKRDWAVLAGLAKLQSERTPRTLQLRAASHRTKAYRLEDGTVMDEPPGVEGYLTRHTGGSSPKEQVYASTHDGYIFLSTRNNAHPPIVPGEQGTIPVSEYPEIHRDHIATENKRIAKTIEYSLGCVDLRDIESISLLDPDKAKVKLKGQTSQWFQVDLGGQTTMFEAYGDDVAKEWVERLGRLSEYWKHRHRVDARLRMDVEKMQGEDDGSDTLLSELWDWCVLKGCRPVCMSGRLFLRKGKWNKFRQRMIVLTGGCLVAFKVKPGQPLLARKQRYPLYGAYTYSGMLAQDELHDSTRENAFAAQARVYQDGLQNTDGIEDRTFCIRLAAKPAWWGKGRTHPWDKVEQKGWAPMPLAAKAPFLLIFRARSRLERDRWIWAINAEMERQVRAHVGVEEKARQYGVIP